MKKGDTVGEPTFRVTRARAAACRSTVGSEVQIEQGQARVLRTNPKRTVLDERNNNVTVPNKRRAVLKNVTNIFCDNSYKNCIIAAKIPKNNGVLARKKVAASATIKKQQVSAHSKKRKHDENEEAQREGDENAAQIDKKVAFPRQSVSKKGKSKVNEKFTMTSQPDFIDIDSDHKDPQMCSLYACEIYNNLRVAELMHRPRSDFMEIVQRDVTQSMRGVLIDWLVEVCMEHEMVPDTLYRTVCLIDLFLSRNYIERKRFQLLGITCMLISSKYEEMCAPGIQEFCFITDNAYTKSEVVKMEYEVLNNLNFQLSVPTPKTFLRRFLRAARASQQVPSPELEFLANYLAELTLIDYNFLVFAPSTIAASAVFLARWTLDQSCHPWNGTLERYTGYRPLDLKNAVLALHALQSSVRRSPLNAIRSKYKQHKFRCVASLTSRELPNTIFQQRVS